MVVKTEPLRKVDGLCLKGSWVTNHKCSEEAKRLHNKCFIPTYTCGFGSMALYEMIPAAISKILCLLFRNVNQSVATRRACSVNPLFTN